MCVVCRRCDREGRVLGWREGDMSCGGLENGMELVVLELW